MEMLVDICAILWRIFEAALNKIDKFLPIEIILAPFVYRKAALLR